MRLLRRLWRDQDGFVVSTELLLVTVVLVLGMLVGATTLRDQVVQEFGDLAAALGRLNQSYSYTGDGDPGDDNYVAGSSYENQADAGEEEDQANAGPAGISVSADAQDEGSAVAPR